MKRSIYRHFELLPRYLKYQRGQLILLGTLLLITIGLELLAPQILRDFIDTTAQPNATQKLIWLALFFMGVVIIRQTLSVLNTYLSENMGWVATNMLRDDLIKHCLHLDIAYHKQYTPGEMIERIDGDATVLSNFFSMFILQIVGGILLLLGVLVMLFREEWLLGLTFTLFSGLALVVLNIIQKRAVAEWLSMRQINADFFGFLGDQLAGTEDIRSSGAGSYVMFRFYQFLQRWLPIRLKAEFAGYKMAISTLAIFTVGNTVALSLSAYLWLNNQITIGTVYLIFYYAELLRRPIQLLYEQMQDLPKAKASIERIEALLATSSQIQDKGQKQIPAGPLSVKFEKVSFTYEKEAIDSATITGYQEVIIEDAAPDNRFTLNDINFELQPGETLGLLGRTGSGKTSLARILLRLHDIDTGIVSLNNTPITDFRLQSLRQHIGLVTQDVQIFSASIRDNLTFFDPTITDEQLHTVLNRLAMSDRFQSLPNGLDTIIGPAGTTLSAGQRQLLAAARSFLTDPGLIILDEASSHLDLATEHLLKQAIDKLLQDRSAIIIAHRLETVQRVDKIMILEKGQVVEYGFRDVLMADPRSRFYQLLKTDLEGVQV